MEPVLFYYLIGFVSGIVCTFLVLLTRPGKKLIPAKARKWSKIENFTYNYEVDHTFKDKIKGVDFVGAMAEIMKAKVRQEPNAFKHIIIDPGSYSITFETTARFIRRDEPR